MADPYTLVQECLQEGEYSRAQLRAKTGCSYPEIEAALYRFDEIMGNVEKRTDGSLIERYKWKGPVTVNNEAETPKPMATNTEGDVTATSLGIRVSENVRLFILELGDGADFTVPTIYAWFLRKFPEAKGITIPNSFKVSINSAVTAACGKRLIYLAEHGKGGSPHIYRKGKAASLETQEVVQSKERDAETAIDLKRLEGLIAAGYSKTEVCAALMISEATLMRRRRDTPAVQAAWNRGIDRFQQEQSRPAEDFGIESDEPDEISAPVARKSEAITATAVVDGALIDARVPLALRAASVELSYFELWGEHSPRLPDVHRLIVSAGETFGFESGV